MFHVDLLKFQSAFVGKMSFLYSFAHSKWPSMRQSAHIMWFNVTASLGQSPNHCCLSILSFKSLGFMTRCLSCCWFIVQTPTTTMLQPPMHSATVRKRRTYVTSTLSHMHRCQRHHLQRSHECTCVWYTYEACSPTKWSGCLLRAGVAIGRTDRNLTILSMLAHQR